MWQPIETAPKTDDENLIAKYFLGWFPNDDHPDGGDMEVCWWEPALDGGCWVTQKTCCGPDGKYAVHPTMWHPCPPVPAKEAKEGCCQLCGLPMLEGEKVFRFHGYSESCEEAKARLDNA